MRSDLAWCLRKFLPTLIYSLIFSNFSRCHVTSSTVMEEMETYAYADSSKSQYVVDHAYDHVYESTTNPETKEHMYDAIIKNKLENVADSNLVPQNQREKKVNPKTSKKLILLVVLTLVFFFCFIIVLILASRNHGFVFQNPSSGKFFLSVIHIRGVRV